MRVALWSIGPTREAWLREGIELYRERLPRLAPFEYREIPSPKLRGASRTDADAHRQAEAALVEGKLGATDRLFLFDERGRRLTSRALADYLERLQHGGGSRIVLLIGGAYGFGDGIKRRAEGTIRLSDLTLTHQMARLLALEQLYRAYSILRGLPYHND